MPKKTTQKKKVVKKVVKPLVVIKTPENAPFDLTFENKDENARISASLEALKQNPGWRFLKQVFEANIEVLKNCILEKVDTDGKSITDEKILDEMRVKHGYLKELLAKPDYYIKQLAPVKSQIDTHDPYFQHSPET